MDLLLFSLVILPPHPQPWFVASECIISFIGGEITNTALPLPVSTDSVVFLEKIWKSFPEFA